MVMLSLRGRVKHVSFERVLFFELIRKTGSAFNSDESTCRTRPREVSGLEATQS